MTRDPDLIAPPTIWRVQRLDRPKPFYSWEKRQLENQNEFYMRQVAVCVALDYLLCYLDGVRSSITAINAAERVRFTGRPLAFFT